MQTIEAKPTYYKYTLFRSKLEVSWAMKFDDFGIRYAYEPRYYNLRHGTYLPDFLIKLSDAESVWIEVKPKLPWIWDRRWTELSRVTKTPLYVSEGEDFLRTSLDSDVFDLIFCEACRNPAIGTLTEVRNLSVTYEHRVCPNR